MRVAGREVIGFPALHDDGDSVSLRPHDTPEEAARVHRRGLARLFALNLKDQVRAVERLPGLRELALQYMSFGTEAELKARHWQREFCIDIEKKLVDSLKEQGMEVSQPDKAKFFEAVQPVYKEFEEKVGKEAIQKLIDAQK